MRFVKVTHLMAKKIRIQTELFCVIFFKEIHFLMDKYGQQPGQLSCKSLNGHLKVLHL